MLIEPHIETLAQRTALRELAALSTIPAAWARREPPIIAAGLADVLVGSLRLDFAFVRMQDPKGGAIVEVTRGEAWETLPQWLRTHLGDAGQLSRKEIVTDLGGAEPCRGVVIPIGVNSERGLVAAACTRTDFPSEIEQLLLSVAVNHAAAAFQNARLRNELDAKVAELHQARNELEIKVAERTAELRRSEAYLAEGQRLAKTGSWAHNPNTERGIYWSEEMRRIFGLDLQRGNLPDREEFLRLVHPEDRDRFNERIDKAYREKADFVQDYRIVLPDGTAKHIHGIGHPVLDETGNVIEYVGTDVDVTERKRAEDKLRRSEADLLEAQRISQTGSWKLDVSSNTVTVSPQVFRIFGIKPDEDTSTPEFWLSRNHPEDQKRIHELFERSKIQKTNYDVDYRIVLPDGSINHIHAVGHPVLNESGELVEFIGTFMDITERKQAEDKIREQEVELRQILDAAPQHLSVLRGDGSHLYINQSSLDFLGLTLEEWQKLDIRELVHPDDAERVARERRQALSSGSPLEIEARMLRYDGDYRWFFLRYKPLKDQLGRITRWVIPAIDIDDRKRSEERLQHENVALREEIDKASMFEEIVGSSPALQTVLSSIVKVAPTDSTVLITGETGTGKELIARAIHKHSQRSKQAFISVNCASIPSSLIASELFGHEKGAFTGAVQRRQGRFELAHSGTIFLDEVGELPVETQIMLLRVLQERQFERVGGNRVLPTDVRVIAATNRDLTAAIAAGRFRPDLFYRLNVFPIEVPPLRKRKEDIPMLVEYFVKRYAEKTGKQICKIDNKTLELCQSYPWPGNIRELQNIVERSVILCSGDTFWIEKAWLACVQPPRQELVGPCQTLSRIRKNKLLKLP